MTQQTVIIEICSGNLEAVYSNADISVFLIDRTDADDKLPVITGPRNPTLIKEDLSKAFPDEPRITRELLALEAAGPYF